MKKILMIITALAMVAAFAPKANAADSAQLGLQVTFADQDLQRVNDLNQNLTVLDADCLNMYKQAADSNNPDQIKQTIADLTMERDDKVAGIKKELVDIATRRPDLRPQIDSVVTHAEQLQATISDYITKLQSLLQVISIGLEGPNPWVLDNVKLGERRKNLLDPDGKPIHVIKNTGNVVVIVDIGYGLSSSNDIPHPGLEQGVDTYVTLEDNQVIPPYGKVKAERIEAGATASLSLTYGAPTGLSKPVTGMGATFELRAYKDIDYPPIHTLVKK